MVESHEGILRELRNLTDKSYRLEAQMKLFRNNVEFALQLIRDAWPEPSEAKHLVLEKLTQALQKFGKP